MRKAKKLVSLCMALLLLLSMLPTAAFAEEVQQEATPTSLTNADEVIYATSAGRVKVGYDAENQEQYFEEGINYQLFEEDGSYVIYLDPDAFFPYQVQFTYEGRTWTEWFMDPDDTVMVGDHEFSVYSYATGTALTGFGATVGGKYIPAYPEETEFPEDYASPMQTFSMLPLEEKTFNLDLTGYFPSELKEVSIEALVGHLTGDDPTADTDASHYAAYAKWSYYDENGDYVSEKDNYTLVDNTATIDLSDYHSGSFSWLEVEIIVGTADQLNPDNVRYRVDVRVGGLYDLFSGAVVDEDRKDIRTEDFRFSYDEMKEDENGNPSAWYDLSLSLYEEDYSWAENGKLYLSLDWGDEAAVDFDTSSLNVKVYEWTDEGTKKDITSSIWKQNDLSNSGGYETDRNGKDLYISINRGGNEVFSGNVKLRVYTSVIRLGWGSLYADGEGRGRTNVVNGTQGEWDSEKKCNIEVYELDEGYAANGKYYFNLSLYDHGNSVENNGISLATKAVVGDCKTAADFNGKTDIKEQLFSDASATGGYYADYSNGVLFSVLTTTGKIFRVQVKTVPYVEREPVVSPLSTYLQVYRADGLISWDMPSDADSYYGKGYQTVFLLNEDDSAVTAESIKPVFSAEDGVIIYAGIDKTSGTEQKSGETEIPFTNGKIVNYSAAAEGTHLENYFVTFLTQYAGGPKLFVNAANDTTRYDETTNQPMREVFLTDAYDNHHDVFFANVGDTEMTNLYVELKDAQNVALDEYWTINSDGVKKLAAFDELPSYGDHAKNVAKIRLQPVVDADGNAMAGEIKGTLVIGYKDATGADVEKVEIKLTGVAGTPKIITDTLVDAVKYVPYSTVIQTNDMYSNNVKFTLAGGKLPNGITLLPDGELYGLAKETGEFTFTVTATYDGNVYGGGVVSDSREFTLTVKENTNANVLATNDGVYGHKLLDAIADEINVTTVDEATLVFRSEGPYAQFEAFYLDSKKLVEGTDYISEEGSTKITVQAQTFKNAGNGTHTIAAEFRDGGDVMKQTAQNVTVVGAPTSGGGYGGGYIGGGFDSTTNGYSDIEVDNNTLNAAALAVGTAIKDGSCEFIPANGYTKEQVLKLQQEHKLVLFASKSLVRHPNAADEALIEKAIKEAGGLAKNTSPLYMEITMYLKNSVTGEIVATVTNTEERVCFTVKLDAAMQQAAKDGKPIYVIRVHDGKTQFIKGTLSSDKTEYKFCSTDFSTFALVAMDKQVVGSVDTGDAGVAVYALTALASLGGAYWVRRRKED